MTVETCFEQKDTFLVKLINAVYCCVLIIAVCVCASCSRSGTDYSDDYMVRLAKPHVAATPPPSGFVPVVEWNPNAGDEFFVSLMYVPERLINLKSVDGIYLHNMARAAEYNFDLGKETEYTGIGGKVSAYHDLNTGEQLLLTLVHRNFRNDSRMGVHMIKLTESVDERPFSFLPNLRFDIEDIVVDGANGWVAYSRSESSEPNGDAGSRIRDLMDARVSNEIWVMRILYIGPKEHSTAPDSLDPIREARQMLYSFKVLDHVKVR